MSGGLDRRAAGIREMVGGCVCGGAEEVDRQPSRVRVDCDAGGAEHGLGNGGEPRRGRRAIAEAGSVVELDGILVVGNIFKKKVKLGFMYGASLDDPSGIFNGELGGNQRRSVEFVEGDVVPEDALAGLVRSAIVFNSSKRAAARAKK